jgi:hypothetical protein
VVVVDEVVEIDFAILSAELEFCLEEIEERARVKCIHYAHAKPFFGKARSDLFSDRMWIIDAFAH